MKKLLNEFKDFALKGNMIDLAVGMIIGGAFNGIVGSLINDIVMPVLSLFTGRIDFTNLFVTLNGESYLTLAAAQAAGDPVISYGLFVTQLINFLVMAFVVFIVVKKLNKYQKKPAPVTPTEKECPFCKTTIALAATRCPHCTSVLTETAE